MTKQAYSQTDSTYADGEASMQLNRQIKNNYLCTRFSDGPICNDFSACKMDYEGHLKGMSLKIETCLAP